MNNRAMPPYPLGLIDYGHPLAKGLVAAFVFPGGPRNPRAIVGGVDLATTNALCTSRGFEADAAGEYAYAVAPAGIQVTQGTIAVAYRRTGTPAYNGPIFGLTYTSADSAPYTSLAIERADTPYLGYNLGGTLKITSFSSTFADAEYASLAASVIDGTQLHATNGKVTNTSTSSGGAITYGANGRIQVGYSFGSRNPGCILYSAYIWSTVMGANMLEWHTAEPYAMFLPDIPSVYYSLPATGNPWYYFAQQGAS